MPEMMFYVWNKHILQRLVVCNFICFLSRKKALAQAFFRLDFFLFSFKYFINV